MPEEKLRINNATATYSTSEGSLFVSATIRSVSAFRNAELSFQPHGRSFQDPKVKRLEFRTVMEATKLLYHSVEFAC